MFGGDVSGCFFSYLLFKMSVSGFVRFVYNFDFEFCKSVFNVI